jgi:hypothetical protein
MAIFSQSECFCFIFFSKAKNMSEANSTWELRCQMDTEKILPSTIKCVVISLSKKFEGAKGVIRSRQS